MKSFLQRLIPIIISAVLILGIAGCEKSLQVELTDTEEDMRYTYVLEDGLAAPDAEVAQSALYQIENIYIDSSLSVEQKIARIMKYAAYNETKAYRFAYFNSTVGTTSLAGNSGTLIYQRTRRQNLEAKYDTTLKLPVNHNFNVIAKNFVTDSTIRLVIDGRYYRMTGKEATYSDTGILSADNWKKYAGKFNIEESIAESQNYEDAQKSAINYDCDGILLAGASITLVESEAGNYYKMTFALNVEVANADSETVAKLERDNGGSNMRYNYLTAVVEVWTSGFMRSYSSDESWEGKIGSAPISFQGSAQSKTYIVYSYSERDNTMSSGIAIRDNLL